MLILIYQSLECKLELIYEELFFVDWIPIDFSRTM